MFKIPKEKLAEELYDACQDRGASSSEVYESMQKHHSDYSVLPEEDHNKIVDIIKTYKNGSGGLDSACDQILEILYPPVSIPVDPPHCSDTNCSGDCGDCNGDSPGHLDFDIPVTLPGGSMSQADKDTLKKLSGDLNRIINNAKKNIQTTFNSSMDVSISFTDDFYNDLLMGDSQLHTEQLVDIVRCDLRNLVTFSLGRHFEMKMDEILDDVQQHIEMEIQCAVKKNKAALNFISTLFGVQPMTPPTGKVFALNTKFLSKKKEDDSLFHHDDFITCPFEIEEADIEPEIKTLKAEWTMELAHDIECVHGLSSDADIEAIIQSGIDSFNNQIIEELDLDEAIEKYSTKEMTDDFWLPRKLNAEFVRLDDVEEPSLTDEQWEKIHEKIAMDISQSKILNKK